MNIAEKKHPITSDLKESENLLRKEFANCDDLKMRELYIGLDKKRRCMIFYIEVSVGNEMINVFGRFVAYLEHISEEKWTEVLKENAFGLSDALPLQYMEEAVRGILIGDAVIFLEGFAGALKIPDKGYPKMGVSPSDTEKVVRGSQEGFTESEKANTALIFRSLRRPMKS